MIDFKDYQSRPITRRAYRIKEGDTISYRPEHSSATVTSPGGAEIDFKCYEEPTHGDFVVYLNADDVYHCSASVFAERNIIPA